MKRKISGQWVDIYASAAPGFRPGAEPPHFLIAVGAKVSKKSTQRNLIKRRLKSILGSASAAAGPGLTIRLSARPGILSAKFSEIKSEIERLFNQL